MGSITYSALGDLGEVLSAGESEGSREGKDGSLETHVCCWVVWVVKRWMVGGIKD